MSGDTPVPNFTVEIKGKGEGKSMKSAMMLYDQITGTKLGEPRTMLIADKEGWYKVTVEKIERSNKHPARMLQGTVTDIDYSEVELKVMAKITSAFCGKVKEDDK